MPPGGRRFESMRDVRNRQLPLPIAALFCAYFVVFPIVAKEGDAADRDLRKLEADATALVARKAGPEEWKKLGAEYAALAARHPKNAAILDAHGEFLWARDDHDRALREWLAAERIEPKSPEILSHLAGASMTLGDPKAALGYYLRAAGVEPGNAHTHFSAANIACLFRHDVGRTEDECFALALKHFAEAHRLVPQSPEYARAYAETFYLLPRPDWQTALKVWQEYLNLMPDKDFALLNLTRVHMKLGDAGKARACLAQVTDPKNERLKNRLAARIETELHPEKPPETPETEKTSKPVIDEGGVRP